MTRVVAAVALICAAPPAAAELRTFTSREGKPLEAEIVDADKTHVELKTADGRTFRVPIEKLSDDDQFHIGIWRDERERQARFEGVTVAEVLRAQGVTAAAVRIEDGLMFVEASVNGKPATFLVDVRQEQDVLDAPAVQKLELEMQPAQAQVPGVQGQSKIESLKFGETELGPATMLVASFDNLAAGLREKIDGILGQQFLKSHDAWLHYGEMQLYLRPAKP